MHSSLQCLLEGVIDYAGLFPPAKLDLKPALDEYLGHLNSQESWIVNRFISPVGRLAELGELLNQERPEASFGITVIGTGGDDFGVSVKKDAEAIDAFDSRVEGQFFVEAYEVKAPKDIRSAIKSAQQLSPLDVFLELPLNADLIDSLHQLAESGTIGAKARTGGLDKASFPSSEVVASFLQETMNLDVPFKLTAGLHHPLPMDDAETGGRMHGFLNVLLGAALVQAHDLSRVELVELLDETNPKAFSFRERSIAWKGQDAGIDDIEEMRSLFVGFGSCSVTEPIEGLESLKLYRRAS